MKYKRIDGKDLKLTIPLISSSELKKTYCSIFAELAEWLCALSELLCPLSNIKNRSLIYCLDSGNTDIAQALEYARLYVHDPAYGKRDYARNVVILISDGIATRNVHQTIHVKYFLMFCVVIAHSWSN